EDAVPGSARRDRRWALAEDLTKVHADLQLVTVGRLHAQRPPRLDREWRGRPPERRHRADDDAAALVEAGERLHPQSHQPTGGGRDLECEQPEDDVAGRTRDRIRDTGLGRSPAPR